MAVERTLIILKPDCMKKGLVGEVLKRFEKAELKIIGLRVSRLTPAMCDIHYEHLKDKPFFGRIVEFMTSMPLVFGVLEGEDATFLQDVHGRYGGCIKYDSIGFAEAINCGLDLLCVGYTASDRAIRPRSQFL